MDVEMLQTAGFGKGEAKVYLALLELGETTTGPLIERSGVSSSKVYEILERLISKGMVSYVIHEKTKHFHAAPPSRLMDWVQKKENELQGQKKTIEKLLPKLSRLQASNQAAQSAQVYEGYEGVRTMFDMILDLHKSGEEYYVFFLGGELQQPKVAQFYQNYHRRRAKRGIRVKLIADLKSGPVLRPLTAFKGFEMRLYPNPMPLGVYVFKDYVGTVSFRQKPTVFLIKSKDIADSYREFFLGLWAKSKRVQ